MAKFKFDNAGKWADKPYLPVFEVEAGEVREVTDDFAIEMQTLGKGKIVTDNEAEQAALDAEMSAKQKQADEEAAAKKSEEEGLLKQKQAEENAAKKDKEKSQRNPAQRDKEKAVSK